MSTGPAFSDHRQHLARLIGAALTAADPGAAVRRGLRLERGGLRVGTRRVSLPPHARLFLIALGKAAPGMAAAAVEILGERIDAGVVTTLVPGGASLPAHLRMIQTGHPLPDTGSLLVGRMALDLAGEARAGDRVLVLVSGGGSAMAECLRPGIGLDDVRQLTGELLHAGAPITAINTIRRELSLLKGGGLARAASPAQVVGLLLSDVVGDDPASVASGPTVLQAVQPSGGRRTLERIGLWHSAPAAIREALRSARSAPLPASTPINTVLASNADLLTAVAGEARSLGLPVQILTGRMQGEAAAVGARLGRRLGTASRPACLLAGGETTVTLRQGGRGGRNQELALSAALGLEGKSGCVLAALASDGIDGPTDAAGAWVDTGTLDRALATGLDPHAALEAHDVYPLLDQLGALLFTGPTGTNLNDLVIGLAYAS